MLRLRAVDSGPSVDADAALLRTLEDAAKAREFGFSGAIVIGDKSVMTHPLLNELPRLIVLPAGYDYLSEGDIVGIRGKRGQFRTLYRRSSPYNSFLVTDRCNHYCLMCSQPPRDIDDGWILDEIKVALPLIDPKTSSLGFTGGEPLLDWKGFIALLADCRTKLPNTAIHVLSNGRAFADSAVVAAWADVQHPNLAVGIPVYSAVDYIHDYVVQAKGAFDETVSEYSN